MVKKYQVSTIQSDAKWLFFMVNLSFGTFETVNLVNYPSFPSFWTKLSASGV